MYKDEIKHFIDSLLLTILQAGELAIESQKKVVNIGKGEIYDKSNVERIKQRGRAKTAIDEKIQEMLLLSIKVILGTDSIRIDAEENTPSTKLFSNTNASLTVVIDPIDGTLEYVSGSDKYSINVGLIAKGRVLTALIYYPKCKQLYCIDENRKAFLITYNKKLQIKYKEELHAPSHIYENIFYTNNRLPTQLISRMHENSFTVVEDDGKVLWPDALLKSFTGEYTASIFHTPHTRDVLLGALVEILGGYMIDWNGNTIQWPQGGRIPRVIFGFGNLPKNFFDSLKE